MNQNIYDMGTADLQRVAVTSEALSRIIAGYTQQGGNPDMEVTALLAQLLRDQVPKNCRYNVYPFAFVNGLTTYQIFQVLPQNLNRKFLQIQFITSGNEAVTEAYVLFEEGPNTPTATDQSIITRSLKAMPSSTIHLNSLNVYDGSDSNELVTLEFSPAPSNAVSLVGLQTSGAITGIIIEGV